MSDFFHANPLLARYVHAGTGRTTSKAAYDVVDESGNRLAYAYEDLGASGAQRLFRDFAQSMADSRRFVVDDAQQRPMLALDEQRGRHRSMITVSWPNGQALGAVTMERLRGASRGYELSDAHGRPWGRIVRHDPHPGRGVLGRLAAHGRPRERHYTATDHQGIEVARITDAKRRDTSLGYETHVSDHVLQLHYTGLPEPLSTLLRAATIAVDFAEFTDR